MFVDGRIRWFILVPAFKSTWLYIPGRPTFAYEGEIDIAGVLIAGSCILGATEEF
jgi:hypothetical protein